MKTHPEKTLNRQQMSEDQFMAQLQATFAQLPNEIPIYMFTDRNREEDVFVQANRQLIRIFRELSPKITFREYHTDHDLAKKWQVTHSPSLLIAPETYHIRWIGAPLGEEGRTFLETLLLVGAGDSRLNEESRKVIRKIDNPRKVRIFVSATCPYCPQEALNGVQAALENPDMVSLEIIDIQAAPEIAKKYGAHSVPQAFANDVQIGMGAQTQEIFCLSLLKLEPRTVFIPESDAQLVENDLVIVGGGPAGLTAGIYAVRSGLNAAIVEKDALGGQVATTPVVENYTGFAQVGGRTLVDIMVSHALQYAQIFQGEAVLDIVPGPNPGDPFTVQTSRRKFRTRAVLLATGATHKHLGVPGESRLSGKGISYCSTCDGPLFAGKKVLMVGGGNSAVTEALHLHHMGVNVTLVHRRDRLRAQDVLVSSLRESGIPVMWNTEIKEIRGKNQVESAVILNSKTGETSEIPVDGVFLSIGYSPAVELAQKIGAEITEDGYIRHEKHRTNIPGIYSAGDVEGGYKQIVTAVGQGAEAAMIIFEDMLHPYWYQKK